MSNNEETEKQISDLDVLEETLSIDDLIIVRDTSTNTDKASKIGNLPDPEYPKYSTNSERTETPPRKDDIIMYENAETGEVKHFKLSDISNYSPEIESWRDGVIVKPSIEQSFLFAPQKRIIKCYIDSSYGAEIDFPFFEADFDISDADSKTEFTFVPLYYRGYEVDAVDIDARGISSNVSERVFVESKSTDKTDLVYVTANNQRLGYRTLGLSTDDFSVVDWLDGIGEPLTSAVGFLNWVIDDKTLLKVSPAQNFLRVYFYEMFKDGLRVDGVISQDRADNYFTLESSAFREAAKEKAGFEDDDVDTATVYSSPFGLKLKGNYVYISTNSLIQKHDNYATIFLVFKIDLESEEIVAAGPTKSSGIMREYQNSDFDIANNGDVFAVTREDEGSSWVINDGEGSISIAKLNGDDFSIESLYQEFGYDDDIEDLFGPDSVGFNIRCVCNPENDDEAFLFFENFNYILKYTSSSNSITKKPLGHTAYSRSLISVPNILDGSYGLILSTQDGHILILNTDGEVVEKHYIGEIGSQSTDYVEVPTDEFLENENHRYFVFMHSDNDRTLVLKLSDNPYETFVGYDKVYIPAGTPRNAIKHFDVSEYAE